MEKSLKTKTAPSRRAAKTVYDSWESVYRRHKPEDLPWYSPTVHPALKTVLDRIPVTKGKALDIGCGLGQVARHLADRGWSVTAVDISASAIRQAKQKTTNPQAAITFRRQNTLTLDPSVTYDLVVDFLHLHDVQPTDLDHYLSGLAQITAHWLIMGYLSSTGTKPIVRPSLYFHGVVTQHDHSGISATLTSRGFLEVSFVPFILKTPSVDYHCEIITFCKAQAFDVYRETRQ